MPRVRSAEEAASEAHCDNSRRRTAPQDDSDDHLSPGKRQKLKHGGGGSAKKCREQRTTTPPANPPRTAPIEAMYSFGADTIDLTKSPSRRCGEGSPVQQRRPGSAPRSPAAAAIGAGGPKKLVVKNFKHKSKHDPDKYLNQIWDQVDRALDSVFAEDTASYSLEELYRGIENVCRQNRAADISRRLVKRCRDHVENDMRISILGEPSPDDVSMLRHVVTAWTTWRKQTQIIRAMFYFLDRSYLLHAASESTIDDLSIDLFRDQILSHPQVESRVIEGTCALVSQDRQGDGWPSGTEVLFRDAIAMYQTMAVFTTRVEPQLLSQSQDFFGRWTESKKVTLSLSDFISESIKLKEREIQRCENYGLQDTKRDIVRQADLFLIEDQVDRLTSAPDIKALIDANEIQVLAKLFGWLELKKLGEKLCEPVTKHVFDEGTRIIFDRELESQMIPRLLYFKKQLDTLSEKAFAKNNMISHGIRETFDRFMNKTEANSETGESGNDKPGEMIAKYVDVILKGGARSIPQINASADSVATLNEDEMQDDELDEDEAISRQLDSVLDLFRFVHGKATFEAFYKKDLAKRLLMNRSASADAEKSMISRLRKECGASFTHNLEQMFKDIDRSREDNSAYKTIMTDREVKQAVDLSVNTLSAAAWPSYPDTEVEIPASVQKATADFEAHYKAKYAGRRLTWKHGLAHCQMRAAFPGGSKELVLSAFQAVVLLHFNGDGSAKDQQQQQPVTYEELREATKLPDAELRRTLQSLACAKYRVLTKSPRGKEVNDGDRFVVNTDFRDSHKRIKINQIQLKETPEEQKQTHERVAADRQFETQAAIVRIMKREKSISHPLLVAEVINALKSRGVINAEDIKKQITKLIDKDYMEDAGNGKYDYVA